MLKAPAKVLPIVPRKPKPARTELKVLNVYVEQIRLWSSSSAQSDRIRFKDGEVEVGPWAARAIHRFCNSPNPTKGEVEDLVTQGIAVIAKCQADLAAGDDGGENQTQVYACQAEMMLDVAVGTVVIRELQRAGDALVAAGKNDDAKELNQFQHRVRHFVDDVRSMLGEAEKQRASEFVSALEGQVIGPSAGSTAPSAPLSSTPEPTTRPTAPGRPPKSTTRPAPHGPSAVFNVEVSQPARSHGYLLPLAVVAILTAFGIYGLVDQAKAPIQGDASESLTAALSGIDGITEVQDRMPYVILTVHTDFWDRASHSKREDWIKDLSRPVARHGYSGLVVRSTSGVPLAEWIEDRGVKFPDRPENR